MEISPNDVLKQIAFSAGYRVHVWDAVENGDPADSYFWRSIAYAAGRSQSVSTFLSPELAWRDCCESNGLLADILEEVKQAGYQLIREPGFIACSWLGPDGQASEEHFASPAEALISCVMSLVAHEQEIDSVSLSP